MQVFVKGNKDKINLTKNHFIASGGEGNIYARRGIVYKIYQNPKVVISHSKMKELSSIRNPNVIKPERLVLSNKNKPIGYTMKHIPKTYALCQIFPKAFRDRTGMDTKNVLHLVQKMQRTISDIHKEQILIVDLNEMNFLVDKKFNDVFFIDVDSYQTKSFPATAIMESIRDRHSSTFSENTDWFSFGVVSFQMFCGIHPYKGKHPTIKGMEDRMKANIPVFHKDVKFPKNVLPFDVIPQAYRDWYKAVLFEGKRFAPPNDPVQVIIIPATVTTVIGNESFDITEVFEYDSNIIKYIYVDGTRVTITADDLYIGHKKISQICNKNMHIAVTPLLNKVISATLVDGDVVLYNSSDGKIPTHNIKADDIMSYKDRIYIKNNDMISELDFVEMGKEVQAVPKHVGNVMENATKFYDGVIIQNVLGSFIASIFPTAGVHYQIQCPEFQGYQIIDAKYRDNVLIVIASQKGKYDKFILRFDSKFSSYSVRKVDDISYVGINFTVLDNGIVVHINENEELEIFSNKKDSGTVKVIDNNLIQGDMKLFSDGMQVMFSKGKKLYKLKMK
jgi:serine/threonine protein kinase